MSLIRETLVRRTLTAAAAAVAAIVAVAAPASAHTPVMLTSCDVLPQLAPKALVGTDPIAWRGVLPSAGSVRSAQIEMQAGQKLIVTLGIPDLAPENQLPTDRLPVALLVAPDGQITMLQPDIRVPLHDPDTDQNYLFLNNYTATSEAGTYSLIAIGRSPVRFFLATGVENSGFHGLARGTVATDEQVAQWYATPATAPQAPCDMSLAVG